MKYTAVTNHKILNNKIFLVLIISMKLKKFRVNVKFFHFYWEKIENFFFPSDFYVFIRKKLKISFFQVIVATA